MKHILLLIFTVVITRNTHAQFTTAGKIEYERKMNVHAQMAEMDDNDWVQKIKSSVPKFMNAYFDLTFDTARSLYKPGKEVEQSPMLRWFANGPGMENVVYTDFNTQKVTANKKVYEQKYLVQDSMRKMDWMVKDEIRTIANFKCRKAVGRIFDSVYVVAFYTDDIPVSGGPEMFGGLPGMILELAIPRLHTTWVADKVDITQPKEADFTVPEKGKKATEEELGNALKASTKDWGSSSQRILWWAIL